MPHFRLITNLSRDKIPKNFLKELTVVLAKTVGKPENKFIVTVIPDQLMAIGGIEGEPCATANLISIGKLSPAENVAHTIAISAKVEKDLGISNDRFMIEFNDMQDFQIGRHGTTIREMPK